MKGVSASIVSAAMILITIVMVSSSYLFVNRFATESESKTGELMVSNRMSPKHLATVCFENYGYMTLSSNELLSGSLYYEVKDGLDKIGSGFTKIEIDKTGNIYFNASMVENSDYTVTIKSKYWTIIEKCRARQDYGLLMYLPFREGSGTTSSDVSLNGNDAVTNATWINGTSDYALRFNGGWGYAKVNANTGFNSEQFTLAFWTLRETNVNNSEGIIDGDSFHVASQSDGTVSFSLDGGESISESLTNDVWTHFVMKYDGTSLKVYRNCSLLSSVDSSYSPSMGDLFIGNSSGDYFHGAIDEVYLFVRALDDTEIPVFCENLQDVQGNAYDGEWIVEDGYCPPEDPGDPDCFFG